MRLIGIFNFLVMALLLCSCQSAQKQKNGKAGIVTVSILPQKTFVEKIAGDDFKVNVLIPRGSSPATYSLLPSQLKDIAGSLIWFRIGHIGFEYAWTGRISEASKNMKVVNLSEGLDLIAGETEQHGDHIHLHGIDPHVWLSPVLVKEMAGKIMNELVQLKPERSGDYKANYLKFVKEIDQLNVEIKNQLSDFSGRKIVVFHPSLSYFVRDYGLEQYALEFEGKEPTSQHMAKVVKMAKEEGIKVIYIQDEFDREHARVFAEEIGGKLVQVRPLEADWSENLKELTRIFVDNF